MALPLTRTIALFHQATHWNLALYIIYRLLFTALSFLLYAKLSTIDYAIWANINSLTFLILLWTDCGLRKSIPRFSMQSANNPQQHKQFIGILLAAQIILVLAAVPLFLYTLNHLHPTLIPRMSTVLLGVACAAFITEGIANHARQLYHAHFQQKRYNLIFTGTLIAEMAGNLMLIMRAHNSADLLIQITIMRGISRLGVIGACMHFLPTLYMTTADAKPADDQRAAPLAKPFIHHSFVMWVCQVIKSLSERNFITPLLTHAVGPEQANIFKVINDAALFFYRVIPKTVGNTDTLLLTHAEASEDRKRLLPIAFTELTTKIAALSLPFVGILVILLGLRESNLLKFPYAFQVLTIIVIGYCIESLFSPYERLLEVKRDYGEIAYAYVPYVLIITLAYHTQYITWLGLIGFIACIHGVRLVSMFMMMRTVRQRYEIAFPSVELWKLFRRIAPWCVSGYLIIAYTSIGKMTIGLITRLMRF